jgi:hypothetical protein
MEATILNEKSILQVMKNNNKTTKIVINTILPKFEYVNKKGELVKPKSGVTY